MLGRQEPKWRKILHEILTGRNYDTNRPSGLRVGIVFVIGLLLVVGRIWYGFSSGEYDRRAASMAPMHESRSEVELIGPTIVSVQASSAEQPQPPADPPTIEPTLVVGITILWEGSPRGIVSEMLCTERVARTGDILFAALRDQPDSGAEPHTPITAHSIIAVVDGKTIGDWYFVRVLYSDIDPANEGKEGYVLKWIVDGTNYPSCPLQPTVIVEAPVQQVPTAVVLPTEAPVEPQPEPTVPVQETPQLEPSVETQRSFKGFISSQNIAPDAPCVPDQFASKVTGIITENGAPYANALILAVSDGGATAQGVSTASGGFEIPGLGCATWTLQVNGQPTEPFSVKVDGKQETLIQVVLQR